MIMYTSALVSILISWMSICAPAIRNFNVVVLIILLGQTKDAHRIMSSQITHVCLFPFSINEPISGATPNRVGVEIEWRKGMNTNTHIRKEEKAARRRRVGCVACTPTYPGGVNATAGCTHPQSLTHARPVQSLQHSTRKVYSRWSCFAPSSARSKQLATSSKDSFRLKGKTDCEFFLSFFAFFASSSQTGQELHLRKQTPHAVFCCGIVWFFSALWILTVRGIVLFALLF
jgi:hypothetical protein